MTKEVCRETNEIETVEVMEEAEAAVTPKIRTAANKPTLKRKLSDINDIEEAMWLQRQQIELLTEIRDLLRCVAVGIKTVFYWNKCIKLINEICWTCQRQKYKLLIMRNSSLPSNLVPSHMADYCAGHCQQSLPQKYLRCQPALVRELSNGGRSYAKHSTRRPPRSTSPD